MSSYTKLYDKQKTEQEDGDGKKLLPLQTATGTPSGESETGVSALPGANESEENNQVNNTMKKFGSQSDGGSTGSDFYLQHDTSNFNEFNDAEDEGVTLPDNLINSLADSGIPAPPDGGWGWVVVLAAFLINFVMDGVTSAFSVLLPQIIVSFSKSNPGIGVSDVAWAGSLLTGISLCTGPVISALTNKYGCRIVCSLGALLSFAGFIGAANAPNLEVLLLTYGFLGGLGFGLLYLPAIVCVSYYFERRRALATGISVSGSGLGAILFAPIITSLNEVASWRQVCIGFSFMLGSLLLAAAAMRPLEISVKVLKAKDTPLLERMADKKKQMENTSCGGSEYFMVQLPDGTSERRLKMSLNADPGVHSGLHLDQLLFPETVIGTPITTNVDKLPTITEVKPGENPQDSYGEDLEAQQDNTKKFVSIKAPKRISSAQSVEEGGEQSQTTLPQRIASAPKDIQFPGNRIPERRISESDNDESKERTVAFLSEPGKKKSSFEFLKKGTSPYQDGTGIISNGASSTTSFDTAGSKDAIGTPKERMIPLHAVPSAVSFSKRKSSTDSSHLGRPTGDIIDEESQFLLSDGEFTGLFPRRSETSNSKSRSKSSIAGEASEVEQDPSEDKLIIRPLSRKDIFYSGSIHHLSEYQSQANTGSRSYHQSVVNIPSREGAPSGAEFQLKKPLICACLTKRTGAFKTALAQMLDFGLVLNPVFLIIAISGVIGTLGFYVPVTYAVSYGIEKGIKKEESAWFVSIIGITSTFGRVGFGLVSDIKKVDSFLVYNICIITMGVAVCFMPVAQNYYALVFLFTVFGTALSGFVSLTSIILVKLLGLENLTNAFGLLIFFRGISAVVGTPISGAIYDAKKSYDLPFYLAGLYIFVSGLISFGDVFVIKRRAKKLEAACRDSVHDRNPSVVVPSLGDILDAPELTGSTSPHSDYGSENKNTEQKAKPSDVNVIDPKQNTEQIPSPVPNMEVAGGLSPSSRAIPVKRQD